MGRNIQVTKDRMLQVGLEMIIEEGYQKVNIKSLAKQLNCSTQPIVWQFGDMETFRKCLTQYAMSYVNGKINSDGVGAIMSFGNVGIVWTETAIEQPNLVKFLFSQMNYQNVEQGDVQCDIRLMMGKETEETLLKAISEQLSCNIQQAQHIMLTLELFTMGLVTMIVFGNVQISKEEARKLLANTCLTQMAGIGVDVKLAESFLYNQKKDGEKHD